MTMTGAARSRTIWPKEVGQCPMVSGRKSVNHSGASALACLSFEMDDLDLQTCLPIDEPTCTWENSLDGRCVRRLHVHVSLWKADPRRYEVRGTNRFAIRRLLAETSLRWGLPLRFQQPYGYSQVFQCQIYVVRSRCISVSAPR